MDGILYGSSSNTRSAKKTMWRVKLPGLHLVKEVAIQGTGRLVLAPTFFLLNQVRMNFQLLIKTKMLKILSRHTLPPPSPQSLFVVGVLFSRCPPIHACVHPCVHPLRVVSLISWRVIAGISSNFANMFIYTRKII